MFMRFNLPSVGSFAAALLVVAASQDTPGFQFLGYGYDILHGNPDDTSGQGDPGYRSNVFVFSRSEGKKTEDGKWAVPDKTTSQDFSTCSEEQEETWVNSAYSYQHSVSRGVGIDASFFGIEFSFSVDYRKIDNTTSTKENIYAHISSECAVYQLIMHLYDPPAVDPDFAAGVTSLPLAYDTTSQEAYMTFVRRYGTHVVSALRAGGRWGWQMQFRMSDYQHMLDNSINVDAGLHFAGLVHAGLDANSSVDTRTMNEVTSRISENRTFNIGGDFSPNIDVWMKSVRESPMPINIVLTPLDELITETYLPGVDGLKERQASLKGALAGYCEYYKGHVDTSVSCTPPQAIPMPQPQPVADNAARLVCVKNSGAFAMSFDLVDKTRGSAVSASSDTYPNPQTKCLDGSQIRARRGDVLGCHVHAIAGDERDCDDGAFVYDERATLQANFECHGTTTIYSCAFRGLQQINSADASLIDILI